MALGPTSTVRLNSGTHMPLLGFGVWQLPPGAVTRKSTLEALKAGYRHVDTARAYRNEADVGEALRESGLKREEVFLTTKIWAEDQGYASALAACDESLARLKVSYLDLYLIHWPVEGKTADTWRAMEKLKADGKCHAVGVSNFDVGHLDALSRVSATVPAVDQVESHPFEYPRAVHERCRSGGIAFEAYSPLARGKAVSDPRIGAVASRVGRTPAQVMLRWGLQHGAVVIPRSSRPEHIRENAQLFDFELPPAEMAALDALSAP